MSGSMASTGCAAGVGTSADRSTPDFVRDGRDAVVTPSPLSAREWQGLARAVMSLLGRSLPPGTTGLAIVAVDHAAAAAGGRSRSPVPAIVMVTRPDHRPGPSEQPSSPGSPSPVDAAQDKAPGELPDKLSLLTERQRQVAALAGMGKTNRQIANQMFLSRHTVNFHLRHVYRKLDIRSRVELALLLRP